MGSYCSYFSTSRRTSSKLQLTHTHTMHFLLLHFPVKLSSRRRSTIGERFLVCIFFDCQIPNNLNQLNLRKKPKLELIRMNQDCSYFSTSRRRSSKLQLRTRRRHK